MSHTIEITRADTGDSIPRGQSSSSVDDNHRDTLRSPDEFYQSSNTLRNTLKRNERSWVDPYEPNAQGTFYHKQFETFRPKFDTLQKSVDLEGLFDEKEESLGPVDESSEDQELAQQKAEPAKFGTWDGVFARCLLNIFGVIMFLRVGWMVGQAGVLQGIMIILLSAFVTALTTASMSALCTNGQIKGGGAYYLTSRSLGPAIGGSVGVLFAIGNAMAVALYLIGFAETLVKQTGPMMTGNVRNDMRIWANLVLVLQLVISWRGLGWVIKIQMVLLVGICIGILLFFVGAFLPPRTNELVGVAGWSNGNLAANMGPMYTQQDGVSYDFFKVFGVFFPAVTGIMAGANISGELKNASYDIPVGTFWAVLVSTFIYVFIALFIGAVATRAALLTNLQIAKDICVNEWIILIGVYAATLSSAIASLVGAPRILQAVAEDDLIPSLKPFAQVNDRGDPIRGYLASFVVAFGCNMIGDLNLVAPLITDFFMIAYLMINFACFALELSHSPGWRPSFRYFDKWTALFGAVSCLVIMFLIDWTFALGSCVIGAGLFLYISYRDPAVNWGTAQDAQNYYRVHKTLLRMRKQKGHVKNWRPGFFILTGVPDSRPHLILFGQTLRKAYGPMFYGAIRTGDYRTNMSKFHESHSSGYLPDSRILKNTKGFFESVIADNFRQGSQMLLQLGGLGALKPNILVIGYKRQWLKETDDEIEEYVDILRDALAMSMGVIICCKFRSINWLVDRFVPSVVSYSRDYQEDAIDEDAAFEYSDDWAAGQGENPIVDVWWLIDDGGLLLLLPYVMQLHSFWSNCVFRLNLLVDSNNPNTDVVVVSSLIKKFRLPLEGPRLIETGPTNPKRATIERFEKLAGSPISEEPRPGVTRRWLRVSELMVEHSRHSGLILITLPIPSKREKGRSYMAMLECLADRSRLPPCLILRGNGESTLTFYSE